MSSGIRRTVNGCAVHQVVARREREPLLAALPVQPTSDLVVERAPDPLGLASLVLALAKLVGPGLSLQLPEVLQAIGGERPRCHRLLDRAAQLGVVAAVAVPAAGSESVLSCGCERDPGGSVRGLMDVLVLQTDRA
jgi:hypothetical protein